MRLTHGTYPKEAFRQRAEVREIFREARKLLRTNDEPET